MNGIPRSFNNSFPSSSVFAVVTKIISIPLNLSTLSYSISGNINCSLIPIEKFPLPSKEFAEIPPEEQPNNLTSTSGECMYEMLLYAYEHLNEFKLILCCSEGTRFSKLIDEMVEIETKGTHDYLAVLEKIGRPAPPIDERLEHILITGMFNTFFELIIHEMPLEEAKHYLKEMRDFYTAGWMKIMGQ